MPLIDKPFKRVAVDIVGPIEPPSEAGHRYILTLVDYGTKYPEAVPLKKITTEAVAEALLNIYSRVGIPEKVLTDQYIYTTISFKWTEPLFFELSCTHTDRHQDRHTDRQGNSIVKTTKLSTFSIE